MNYREAFRGRLTRGEEAEDAIARWIETHMRLTVRWHPENRAHNGAPSITLPDGRRLKCPDMLVSKEGRDDSRDVFVEAKRKDESTWYRKGRRWETGIDVHYYDAYCEVEQETGHPVTLAFLHTQPEPSARDLSLGSPTSAPTGLYVQKLHHLATSESHRHPGSGYGGEGMVYWGLDRFLWLASVEHVLG
ncbi:MAG: hypothetical protein HN396_04490 [Gemmatimonadales bacterium]|jgi:hypothetical protein|nr:hypothetical protein [Gemmatimonadales bacterium]